MNKNVGLVDRSIRLLLGAGLLAIVFVGPRAWWGLLGFIPLMTAFAGVCPAYGAIGISTRSPEQDGREHIGGRLIGL